MKTKKNTVTVEQVKYIFGQPIGDLMEMMVNIYKETNMSPDKLAIEMEGYDSTITAGLELIASTSGYKETAERIRKAEKIIEAKRIRDFKNAVADGKEEEYLNSLSFGDKISMRVILGLHRVGSPNEKPYTEEEQKYHEILEKAIKEDVKKQEANKEFDTDEEWQEENASLLHDEEIFPIFVGAKR